MSSLSDQMGFNFRGPERRVWKVRELVAAVRTHIEREYPDAWVEGEISNFRAPDSGHLYFTLKDGNAQIKVVMFRSSARLLRFRPADGLQVVVRGRITIYEDRGELQIAAEYIEPKGAGSLQLAFEQLKAKLEAEGLFAAERKKPIPTLPSRIGIVTSAQAAALRDILNILQRRHHSANVLIFPAQVQGDAAPSEIAAGIRYFNQHDNVDVIIIARGGGSAEDLSPFNNEGLARMIAASEIPVISAVGHETSRLPILLPISARPRHRPLLSSLSVPARKSKSRPPRCMSASPAPCAIACSWDGRPSPNLPSTGHSRA